MPFFKKLSDLYFIAPSKPEEFIQFSNIHAQTFSFHWDPLTFEQLLTKPNILAYSAYATRNPSNLVGFIIVQHINFDAEILTFAVLPKMQHKGIGYRLLAQTLYTLYKKGSCSVFLEVAETNAAALTLYKKFNFLKIGQRNSYYQTLNEKRQDALILKCTLGKKEYE